jgi:hypothetical protein
MKWTSRVPKVSAGYLQTARSLGAYRILFGLGLLLTFTPGRQVIGGVSREVGHVPDDFYHPPLGPFSLLSGWPSQPTLLALEIVMTIALVMITIGAFTRSACLTFAVTGTTLAGFVFSTGKVDHIVLWTLVIPGIMAFTPWGDHLSVDSRRRRIQLRQRPGFRTDVVLPIQLVAVALSVMFAAAGIVKAASGWLTPGDSAVLGWTLRHQVEAGLQPSLPTALAPVPLGAWPILDYITVVFEIGFLVAVLRRQWFVPYLVLAMAFHLGAAIMGLPGFNPIAVVYLLFLRLDRAADSIEHAQALARRHLPVVVTAATVGALGYVGASVALERPVTLQAALEHLGLPSGVILWALPLALAALVLARSRGTQSRAGSRTPNWLMSAAVLLLAVQTTVTLAVSEPFPSVVGPLFMGSPDTGRVLHVRQQRFVVMEGSAHTTVPHRAVLALSPGGATLLGKVRFPAPPSGEDFQSRLADQGHSFSSHHLKSYGGNLSASETAYIRRSLTNAGIACGANCTLRVEWYELTFGRQTGRLEHERLVSHRDYAL